MLIQNSLGKHCQVIRDYFLQQLIQSKVHIRFFLASAYSASVKHKLTLFIEGV
jgi:hypothetical protein